MQLFELGQISNLLGQRYQVIISQTKLQNGGREEELKYIERRMEGWIGGERERGRKRAVTGT